MAVKLGVLKEAIKQSLLHFERKILRGIFGPIKELIARGESKQIVNSIN
jgi:hypothetical protein